MLSDSNSLEDWITIQASDLKSVATWLNEWIPVYWPQWWPSGCHGPLWNLGDGVIKWKHSPRYWPFVRGIHWSAVYSHHKGQCRGALMFSLICAWISSWANNGGAGDLRRHRAHYDGIVMWGDASKFRWSKDSISHLSFDGRHCPAVPIILLTISFGNRRLAVRKQLDAVCLKVSKHSATLSFTIKARRYWILCASIN